jgi:PAS domain S-box-containing protein
LHAAWRRLTEPSPALADVGDRRSARLLASLLLIVMPLGLASAVAQLLTVPGFRPTFNLVFAALVGLAVTYVLSRTARYRVAGLVASMLPIATGGAVGLSAPDDPVWFAFAALGPLLASAFLSAPQVAGVAAVAVAVTAAVLAATSRISTGDGVAVLIFSVAVSVLVAVVTRHRAAIELAKEEAVKESQALYRVLFDQSPLGIAVTNSGGRLLAFNEALPRLGGYSPEVLRNLRNIAEHYYDPATRDTVLAKLARDGRVVAEEVRMRASDGSPLDVALSLVPITFAGEQCFLAISQDISKRKRDDAERARLAEALRGQERRFAAMIEHTSDLIVLIGADGTLRYANPALTTILGHSPDAWLGRNVLDLVHPDDRASAHGAFERSLANPRQVISGHLWLRHADGSARLLEGFGANHVDDPATNGIVISGRDVTERRRVDEAISRNEQRLRVAIDLADLAVFEMDDSLRYTWLYNPHLGYATQDVVGRTDHELLGEDGRLVMAIKRRVLESGQRERQEVRVRAAGRESWFDLTVEPVRSDAGAVTGLRGATLDITDSKSLRAQFLQSQKMETLGRLAGGIAHDFNNLLTVITGTASLAASDLPPETRLHHDLEGILRAGERAAALTGQLLAFSRKQMLQPAVVNLDEVVANVAVMLRRVLGGNIELTTVPTEGLGSVSADPGQIEQVLVNLAVNARDAMPGGGVLTIETGNVVVDAAQARTLDMAPGPAVRLSVRDTGVGMDQATRERVFEPFFTTKPLGTGTGLGLSTVYGIIKQSGGGLAVASEPGQGCTFEIVLPRIEGLATPAPPVRLGKAQPGTETVLIVEDEPAIRTLAERLLSASGYAVIAAGSGTDALQVADGHVGPIDLLVTDVVMPNMDGVELAARLRRARPGVKVLYMSGFADEAVHTFEAGAHFIAKPFPMAELAQRVRDVLDSPPSR